MKTIIHCIGILFLFISCSENNDSCDPDTTSGEIKLQAAVKTMTKAPINSGFTSDFQIGVYARGSAWLAGSSANLINNDAATVAGAAGHNVTFGSGPYYYPADGSDANFFAFAPRGTESTPAATGASPVVDIAMTGQEDIMYATATGHKIGSAAAVPPVLNFAHKLTQLQFTFVSGATYPAGNKVVSLTVNAQPTKASMTVEGGTCTFTGTAPMQALSTGDQTAGIAITAATGTNANSPVMTNIASGSPAYTLTIIVKPSSGSNVTYTNVPVTTITPVIGSAHMITLTFSTTSVTATASVADWATGTGGGVTVL